MQRKESKGRKSLVGNAPVGSAVASNSNGGAGFTTDHHGNFIQVKQGGGFSSLNPQLTCVTISDHTVVK